MEPYLSGPSTEISRGTWLTYPTYLALLAYNVRVLVPRERAAGRFARPRGLWPRGFPPAVGTVSRSGR